VDPAIRHSLGQGRTAGAVTFSFTVRPPRDFTRPHRHIPVMASAADAPYEQVKAGLARTLRRFRHDVAPGEIARQLLAYDVPDHTHLVGIDRTGEKAVLYHCEDAYVVFVRFGADGLADGGARLGSLDRGPGIEAWVAKMGAYWGWMHPRYRVSEDK
jgi:hypothetical protein